jgi:hypothetical protein
MDDRLVRWRCAHRGSLPSTDIREIPGDCEATIGLLTGAGNASLPVAPGSDLVSGYFCEDESEVRFFTLPLPSDNSLAGPNIFLGRLNKDRIMGSGPHQADSVVL